MNGGFNTCDTDDLLAAVEEDLLQVSHAPSGNNCAASDLDAPPDKVSAPGFVQANKVAIASRIQNEREVHARKVCKIAGWTLVGWAVFITASGFGGYSQHVLWSDSIVKWVTSAVTINVLGAYVIVIRGLFNYLPDRNQL